MSYELIGPDTQGLGATPHAHGLVRRRGAARSVCVTRGDAIMVRRMGRNMARSARAFYSGAGQTVMPNRQPSGFPSQTTTLGFSLNPFRMLRKIIGPGANVATLFLPAKASSLLRKANMAAASMVIPGGPALKSVVDVLMSKIASRPNAWSAPKLRRFKKPGLSAPTPIANQATPQTVEPVPVFASQSAAPPESYGGGGGGGGSPQVSTDTEAQAPAGFTPSPLLIGGLALVAFTLLNRKR